MRTNWEALANLFSLVVLPKNTGVNIENKKLDSFVTAIVNEAMTMYKAKGAPTWSRNKVFMAQLVSST